MVVFDSFHDLFSNYAWIRDFISPLYFISKLLYSRTDYEFQYLIRPIADGSSRFSNGRYEKATLFLFQFPLAILGQAVSNHLS